MIVTDWTREALAVRREERRLKALGYRKHETDWEIHRGFRTRERIVDVKVSIDGKYVRTLIGIPHRTHEADVAGKVAGGFGLAPILREGATVCRWCRFPPQECICHGPPDGD